MTIAAALAHPNIAFIKYWGNREDTLHLLMNGSISMNLDGLSTRTTVGFQSLLSFDELITNGKVAEFDKKLILRLIRSLWMEGRSFQLNL